MNLWSDLVTCALLGTARAPLPAWPTGDAPLTVLLRGLERDPAERGLLAAAAVVDTWQRAGALPLAADRFPLPPALDEERLPCPPRAGECLAEILSAGDEQILGEWLDLLAAKNRALPHRWLPELLQVACESDSLREKILPVLGTQGTWLAAQHPDWQSLVLPADPAAIAERWQAGTTRARLGLLRHLRAVAPEQARNLALATWDQDAAQDRVQFAQAFLIGLGPTDEPFLEKLLDDRSKQVRAVVAGLLARLPGSGLVQRNTNRLHSLLAMKSGFLKPPRLAIALPAAYTSDMARDGIAEKAQSIGNRTWWLLQMIATVPPAHWAQAWGRPPGELIALAAQTDQEWPLLEGWVCAAARHQDPEWATALLQRWLDKPWGDLSSWKAVFSAHYLPDLVACVPQIWLETWLSDRLDVCRSNLLEQEALLRLFQWHRRPWGEGLTHTLIDRLRTLAVHYDGANGSWYMALPDLALYAHPDQAGDAGQGWPAGAARSKQINGFVTRLRFRHKIAGAFH